MLLSAVSVLVVAQSSSEIPEGLMNNPVHIAPLFQQHWWSSSDVSQHRELQKKNTFLLTRPPVKLLTLKY